MPGLQGRPGGGGILLASPEKSSPWGAIFCHIFTARRQGIKPTTSGTKHGKNIRRRLSPPGEDQDSNAFLTYIYQNQGIKYIILVFNIWPKSQQRECTNKLTAISFDNIKHRFSGKDDHISCSRDLALSHLYCSVPTFTSTGRRGM